MRARARIAVCSTVVFAFVLAFGGFAWAEESEKININTATLEELVELKRVGSKIALRIIDYRSETPFETPEDIMKVPGIGKRIYEENKDLIVVE